MRLAVISDVHGNRLALEAVLEDIGRQSVDGTLNLGDVVSGPLAPVETLDLLIPANFPTVRGNHDRAALDEKTKDKVDRFAHERLTSTQREWLAGLPATRVVDDIFMCHGTPSSDTAPWLDNWWTGRDTTLPDEASVTSKADGLDFPMLLCGHTHIPRIVRLRDGRMIVNPGAVGLQIVRGLPDARYAIIERRNGRWQAALHSVPYDFAAAAGQAQANGFAQWTDALTTGWAGAEGLFG